MVNDESASWHIVNGTHQIKAHTFSKKKLKQTQRIGQCETVVVWDPGWEMIWWCGVRGGASRHIFRCAWVRLFDSIKCKANDISHGSVRFSSNNISIQFQISVARSTHTHTHTDTKTAATTSEIVWQMCELLIKFWNKITVNLFTNPFQW